LRQFGWFCVSGALAFLVDAGVLQLLLMVTAADPYSARLVSFLCAVTTTWLFNRTITFAGRSGLSLPREWALYVTTQLGGFTVNYALYAALVFFVPLVREWPVLGVAAGSLAGLAVNFAGASRLVFRARKARQDRDL
jgi:putative flippase GtrA